MDQEIPKDTSPEAANKEKNDAEHPLVQRIETFKTDVEKYIRENNVSAREAAAALKAAHQPPAPDVKDLPLAPTPAPPPINPHSMVLPDTAIHSPMNASRVDASVLLKQETQATLPKAPPAPPLPIPQKPKTATPPIQTYQEDAQNYVREQKVSNVTVAAAEEHRREEQAAPIQVEGANTLPLKLINVLAGVVLIGAALGVLSYVIISRQALPSQLSPVAPFIAVDQTVEVPLSSGSARNDIMQSLTSAKGSVKLSLGLVAQLLPYISSSTGKTAISAQTMLSVLTPNIPSQLLRSLRPNFLLGVHSFDVNQPFLILSVDSYESGYAGMLAWESTMPQDLSPLFNYTPVVSTQPAAGASSSPAAPAVIKSLFGDTIIQNHDARAIQNSARVAQLLWTFLDRNTILITTNPNTVKEIITRQKNAPTITIPGK